MKLHHGDIKKELWAKIITIAMVIISELIQTISILEVFFP